MRDAPAVGERVDEEEPSAGLGIGVCRAELWQAVVPGVGDLDAQGVADDVEHEPEVAARYAAVGGGVARELGHHEVRRVQWEPPGAELLGGEQSGQTGSAWCGGQQHAEVADGAVELGLGVGGFLIHVTQRGGICLR